MRAHFLQHVPFEGPGSMESWLKSHAYELTYTRFFESTELPDSESIDFLVIMGGPMSVNDEDKFPWLVTEKKFVREVMGAGKPVLGICLGAQIIASAMGAIIYSSPEKEIGWFPVQGVDSSDETTFRFPASETVFHWHGETFDLPPGAKHLAKSDSCENQAFQLVTSLIGLQFHPETTPEAAKQIVTHCRDELVPSRYVQTEEEILSAHSVRYKSNNLLMDRILAFLQQKNT